MLVSIVAAVAEGAAILVVVRVAVELASDTVSADFVPVVGAPTRPITAIAIAGGFALVTLGAHYLIARESSSAAAQVLRRSRERAIRAYRKATWPTQARQRLGSLQETVATLSLLTSAMANLLATGVANLVMLAVFLMIAFVVNPAAMAFVTIAGIGILAAIRPLTRRNQAASNAFTRVDSHFSEEMTNFAAGVMELRSFGVLEKAGERLENDLGTVVERLRVVRFRTALATTLYRDIAVLMLIGSVGALVLTGADSVGSSSAIVVLIVRAMASAQAVNSMVQNIGERGATLELLIERIEELEADPDEPGSVALERLDRLELRGVQYAYGEGSPVLKGVDLVVDRGRVIGVTGPSGSGKSTLLQLLLGLREPTAGRLMVNGTDIRAIDDADWARSVAYVPQEPTLFEQSIAENVAFFRDISRERVVQAAVAANVYDELMRFPSGIDTWLGPLGSGLSGGQKQRVALARALAGDPDLMVLDEPSSALDAAAEVAFRETIRDLAARDCAVLIVSHRPESLEVCDAVFRMEDGVLVPQVQPAGDEAPAGDR